ncbi:MAG: metallophosphoesterase [Caldilineaceae bacterium]|nr:metallophosphoesterase [Caldilineaceae bacterium]
MRTTIPALLPTGPGHQFVCYADSCSGIPGAPHAATFAAVNGVVAQLEPPPDFICFPGDEISGLTADDAALRQQWAYWFTQEMAWLDRTAIPLYHTTANHTVYDPASEAIFREVMAHLPRNGPSDQLGLSYFVRRGDLLLVFVNTLWSGLGGEGYVEVNWLNQVLTDHADARYKMVLGHHPVFPINGFAGARQREIVPACAKVFWQLLVQHGVLAYWCSHILAFDVQVQQGVLQIVTAGAGTAHRMPEGVEYLHCVQAALDERGLRYQVLDTSGQRREWLRWPVAVPPSNQWQALPLGEQPAGFTTPVLTTAEADLLLWRFRGQTAANDDGTPQTLFTAYDVGAALAPLWIGLIGREQQLGVLLAPQPGRSPHLWTGPVLGAHEPFMLQCAIHTGMGPGGLLWRWDDESPWSSLTGISAWGAERLPWPSQWRIGQGQRGPTDRPFRGDELRVSWQREQVTL